MPGALHRAFLGMILSVLGVVAGCGADPAPTVGDFFFPRHTSPYGTGDMALLEGELAFEDGCLWIRPDAGGRVLVLWSSDVVLGKINDRPAILTGERLILAETGERLGFGGSATDRAVAERLVGPIPDRCANGGFWVLSTINGRP